MKKTKHIPLNQSSDSLAANNQKTNTLHLFVLLGLFLFINSNLMAQSWDMNLNIVKVPDAGKIGTANNEALHFYTNGIKRLTINNDGALLLPSFTGEGNRFIISDGEGRLFPWTGDVNLSNHLLYGDGTWKVNPFTITNNRLSYTSDIKIGIGGVLPETELDITGNARISKNLMIGAQLQFGSNNTFASFHFTPGNAKLPNVISFNTGTNKSTIIDNGNTENNGNDDPDPLPDLACLNGNISTINTFNNVISVFAPYNSSSVGNINFGHNGINAFIETQGNNPAAQNNTPGQLHINAACNRNVVMFSDNGNPFANNVSKVLSVHGRVNVSDLLQIGHPSLTNFMETAAKLYVYGSGMQDGVKVRHGGVAGGAAFKAVELSDNDKGIAVYRGNQTSDGAEMFSVQGDGLTVLSPINTKALSVTKNNNETFSINNDGYTEIKVYSPSGMPNNRVMSVVDLSSNRDLFAIKSNGKVYAREIEINLLQTFPDYVFNDDYRLMDLNTLENYISLHKHLPGFENAAYYEKNGLNVQEMLVKQQEKIEELTLYIIRLEKQINQH